MENMMNIAETSTSVVKRLAIADNLDERLKTLKRKLEVLSSRSIDVNNEVEYAELQGKTRKREVESWLIYVRRIENEVQGIDQEVQESGVFSRVFKLGNQIEKLIGEVAELIDRGRFPQGLTLDAMEIGGYPLLTTKLVGEEFQRNLDKILESLMKIDVLSVGIHGMGGVGKTNLMMHIHNRLLENLDSFNVCWVTVSQDFSIKRLQTDIANTIGLNLSNEDDVKKRAAKLAQALRTRKKIILILDDVWECFSPQEVGIPIEVNGCKWIITTRFLDMCRSMDCSKNITVLPLNEEGAWNLFMEKLGHDIALPVDIEDIARSIVKECAGLPLGIITVAGSMKGMGIDIHGWKNALEELNDSKAEIDGMKDKVFGVLKFSYSNLKDPKLQQCFLYCSLYSEDFKIRRDELIDNMIDEGIIERKRSRQAEFNKGHAMLNKLENAYLLEGVKDDNENKCVKMHDLVRDMALQIARDSHRFMVEAGKGLRDLPDEEEWTDDLVKVSFMSNSFSKIPSNASPRCPKLSTLMLNNSWSLRKIGYSFFVYMTGLKILNLSYTSIKDLPDSVSNLKNLTALLLRGCRSLRHVPSLAKLISLRRLDLEDSGMVDLRYLNLCNYDPKIFPTGILPKPSHLQHLKFDNNLRGLLVKGEEIASLKKLETFKGPLHNIHNFNTYIRSLEKEKGGPTNYLLQVGVANPVFRPNSSYLNKRVIFQECSISKSKGGEDSLVLPKDVQYLELHRIRDLSSLCDIPSFNVTAGLKQIYVDNCFGMDHILSSSSLSYCILPLQSVESVYIMCLNKLLVLIREERAGSSPVPPGTFSQLKVFRMGYCLNIEKLFMPGLLPHLHNLEEIDVHCCDKLVEIIGASSNEVEEEDERNKEEGMDTTIFSLPKLRVFRLCRLPELKSICTSNKVMGCDSIQEIEIGECPKLKRLPLSLPVRNEQLCPPPSLKRIQAKKKWWKSLEWDHPNSKTVLESVFVVCNYWFYGRETGDLRCPNYISETSDEETSNEETGDEATSEEETDNEETGNEATIDDLSP